MLFFRRRTAIKPDMAFAVAVHHVIPSLGNSEVLEYRRGIGEEPVDLRPFKTAVALERIREAAAIGLVRMWGHVVPSNRFEEIPARYWDQFAVDYEQFAGICVKGRQGKSITIRVVGELEPRQMRYGHVREDDTQYEHLELSSVEVAQLWPVQGPTKKEIAHAKAVRFYGLIRRLMTATWVRVAAVFHFLRGLRKAQKSKVRVRVINGGSDAA